MATHIEKKEQLRPMTGYIGAEIIGADLTDGRGETAELVRGALLRHRVVVVRDQFLAVEDQVAFGRLLGNFTYTRSLVHNSARPEIYMVENPGKGSPFTENWHTDGTTSARPPSFSILAAQVLPSVGGDTLFVNMVRAYERLSPAYRRMLRGLRLHHVNRLNDGERLNTAQSQPEQWHPIVRVIPETGERALYPGFPGIADEIEGWAEHEARPVLDFLFNHSLHHDSLYRHRWLPGDVLFWDNRTTMHYPVHDYGDAERSLSRLMIEGEEPYDLPYAGEA